VTLYYRPLGLISGNAAADAIAAGSALPLAGGPLAFTLVEVIERRDDLSIARTLAPAGAVMAEVAPHTASRAPFGPTKLGAPIVMGIVNVTPDSFSDGGAFDDAARAIDHGKAMIAAGASIVDVGGESTRPGAVPVAPDIETARVVPVIAGLRAAANAAGALISVDTRNAATMAAALQAGADIVNDVSALTHDPASLGVVARAGAAVILMHMQGTPDTMQAAPRYADVALDVYDALAARIALCIAAGIDPAQIAADPGIGFGKTVAHNLALLDQLSLFHGLGVPLLVGVSRKGFIARLSRGEPPSERLPGSLAAGLAAIGQGCRILRVHDVSETMQAVRVATASWWQPAA
jgi:dihydropteroate synthase